MPVMLQFSGSSKMGLALSMSEVQLPSCMPSPPAWNCQSAAFRSGSLFFCGLRPRI